jgi:hypothetical protein
MFFSYSSSVLRIRIRIEPHHFGNLDPHQIKIRIRIKRDPETDTHQFADDKSKCMEYEPILALFQGFEPLLRSWDLDPDQHQDEKSDPNPHQIKIRIRIRIRVTMTFDYRKTLQWWRRKPHSQGQSTRRQHCMTTSPLS